MSETTLVLPGQEPQTGEATGTPRTGIEVPLGETATLTQDDPNLPTGAAILADVEPDLEPETPQPRAFAASHYRLDIPTVDGVDAEKIIIAFAGAVELDMGSDDDLAMFNALTLGKEVELRVAGVVKDRLSPLKEDKDGVKTMTRKAKVAVHTVYVVPPEEL